MRTSQAGVGEESYKRADELWREVVALTMSDTDVADAVARSSTPRQMQTQTETETDQGPTTDTEMEVRPGMASSLAAAPGLSDESVGRHGGKVGSSVCAARMLPRSRRLEEGGRGGVLYQ